jgi:hypothetical protein
MNKQIILDKNPKGCPNYIQSPNVDVMELRKYCSRIFLAGGIIENDNWQEKVAGFLTQELPRVMIFNPRRESFDMKNDEMLAEQTQWEKYCLKNSTHIAFWFPSSSLCPLSLFELGKYGYGGGGQHIEIGMDINYPRRQSIIEQLSGDIDPHRIHETLEELCNSLKNSYFEY